MSLSRAGQGGAEFAPDPYPSSSPLASLHSSSQRQRARGVGETLQAGGGHVYIGVRPRSDIFFLLPARGRVVAWWWSFVTAPRHLGSGAGRNNGNWRRAPTPDWCGAVRVPEGVGGQATTRGDNVNKLPAWRRVPAPRAPLRRVRVAGLVGWENGGRGSTARGGGTCRVVGLWRLRLRASLATLSTCLAAAPSRTPPRGARARGAFRGGGDAAAAAAWLASHVVGALVAGVRDCVGAWRRR